MWHEYKVIKAIATGWSPQRRWWGWKSTNSLPESTLWRETIFDFFPPRTKLLTATTQKIARKARFSHWRKELIFPQPQNGDSQRKIVILTKSWFLVESNDLHKISLSNNLKHRYLLHLKWNGWFFFIENDIFIVFYFTTHSTFQSQKKNMVKLCSTMCQNVERAISMRTSQCLELDCVLLEIPCSVVDTILIWVVKPTAAYVKWWWSWKTINCSRWKRRRNATWGTDNVLAIDGHVVDDNG